MRQRTRHIQLKPYTSSPSRKQSVARPSADRRKSEAKGALGKSSQLRPKSKSQGGRKKSAGERLLKKEDGPLRERYRTEHG